MKMNKQFLVFIGRSIVIWLSEALGLIILTYLDIGFSVNSLETAILVIGIVGLINALFWPLLSKILLPFMVFTVGVGSLLINGLIIWVVSELIPGVIIEGGALFLVPLGLALINVIVSAILTVDDDASYYRTVLRNNLKNKKTSSNKSGFIILEIDGLSEETLKKAIAKGKMPTLKKWLEEGTHRIKGWETDLSSQTGASQAGILHGQNKDIPGFRWVEKENNNRIMVSTGLSDAPLIEKRISNGNGLLSANGASRTNLFSGDAEDVIFTYSTLKNLKKFYNRTWYYFYSNPSNFARTIVLLFWDMIMELRSRWRQWRNDIKPRIKRSLVYIFVRAAANVFLREITTYTLIGDIFAGEIDIAYVTYLGYDEIAHHSGVEDEDAFYALKGLDKQFKRLESAVNFANRPYHLIVQSDHGQTNGATFKQRYGYDLEGLVRKLLPQGFRIHSEFDSNQDHFGQIITDPLTNSKEYVMSKSDEILDKSKNFADNTIKTINENKYVKGRLLKYINNYRPLKEGEKKPVSASESQMIVLASGNLGLIYFTEWKERMSYEMIKHYFPDLIPGLANHEGIGFLMIHSENFGPLVIGSEGIYYLADDTVEGVNPLNSFGSNAPHHLKRTDSFKYVPDILVNSFYDEQKDEVAAFEELVGSHGGLGGNQTKPFIMHPSHWNLDNEEIVGAEKLHEILKSKFEYL
ncbi:MAG: phage holin family protein [Methanobacteriaceae archaeon]|nr:phage holin family protein [Methanobacteriaceae archaeon]